MSTKYKRHHGIEMVSGASVRNLQLESLSVDPVTPDLGRLWVNSVTGLVKFATLDEQGATVVKTVGDESAINDVQAAIDLLNGTDAQVGSVAYAVDQMYQTIMGGATQATLDQISELAAAIGDDPNFAVTVANQIQTAKSEVEAAVATDIATLTTATGDAAAKITNIIAGAGFNADGTISNLGVTNYLGSTTNLVAMVVGLDTAIKLRQDAITALENKLGDLTNLTTTEKSTIVAALNEVHALVGSEITGLKTVINGKTKVYDSAADLKTVHTFVHGFTDPRATFDVQVYEAGVWLTDGVACENDATTGTVTVELATAARVQIIVQDATPYAV